jgi:hypothetical protein
VENKALQLCVLDGEIVKSRTSYGIVLSMVVFDIDERNNMSSNAHKLKMRIWVSPGAGRIPKNSGGYSAV